METIYFNTQRKVKARFGMHDIMYVLSGNEKKGQGKRGLTDSLR